MHTHNHHSNKYNHHSQQQAFLHSGRTAGGFTPLPLPTHPLPIDVQCKIRDRCSIMARHVYAERGDAFADQQVARLLHSMGIDAGSLPAKVEGGWEAVYRQQGVGRPGGAEVCVVFFVYFVCERVCGRVGAREMMMCHVNMHTLECPSYTDTHHTHTTTLSHTYHHPLTHIPPPSLTHIPSPSLTVGRCTCTCNATRTSISRLAIT